MGERGLKGSERAALSMSRRCTSSSMLPVLKLELDESRSFTWPETWITEFVVVFGGIKVFGVISCITPL